MERTDKQIAVIFKALCDENRIRLLRALQHGERCACHLLEEIRVTQPTLSHHMKVLCDSGLVESRREGKWIYYRISSEGADVAVQTLLALTDAEDAGPDKCCCP